MEEIRAAALAYYETSSNRVKVLAEEFFNSLGNNQGEVRVRDILALFEEGSYGTIEPNLLEELRNKLYQRQGFMDFQEFIATYYLIKSRWPCCKNCGAFIKELIYYICVDCFRVEKSYYHLCTACFGHEKKTCINHHTFFMDNRLFLLSVSKAVLQSETPPIDDSEPSRHDGNFKAKLQNLKELQDLFCAEKSTTDHKGMLAMGIKGNIQFDCCIM